MRIKTFLIMFLFITTLSFADSVLWHSSYEEAIQLAAEENKNIFVLITAPSWCVWCIRLEDNVLSKVEFQEYLTENYIALKLLDVVDGLRNPELENFNFKGFPTVSVYDSDKGFVGDIYTQSPDEMLTLLKKFKDAQGIFTPLSKDLKLPDKYTFQSDAISDGGGEYINNFDGTWTLKTSKSENTYLYLDNDYEYLYLERDDKAHHVALPMNGSDRHISSIIDEQFIWLDLSDVKRIGGDEYFDNLNKNEIEDNK